MIRKTDEYITRLNNRLFYTRKDTVRIETWWLFWLIPVYSRQTVIETVER